MKLELKSTSKEEINVQILDRICGALVLAAEICFLLTQDNCIVLGNELCLVAFLLGMVGVVYALGLIRSQEWAARAYRNFFMFFAVWTILGGLIGPGPMLLRVLVPLAFIAVARFFYWRLDQGDFG